MRVDLTAAQVAAIRIQLLDAVGDDAQLWADTLEGQTDLFECVSALLNDIEEDEGQKAALTEQMDARKMRRDRCDVRIQAKRNAIAALMEAAGLDKLQLPEATISYRMTSPKLEINDAAAVPDEFMEVKRVPSKTRINEQFSVDGPLPNWLRADPAKPSIAIRRK